MKSMKASTSCHHAMRSVITYQRVAAGMQFFLIVALTGMTAGAPTIADAQSTQSTETSVGLSARDLLTLREIGGYTGNLSVSPDGRYVAFQVQQADPDRRHWRVDWYAAPIGVGSAVHLGGGGELMLSPAWFGRIHGGRAEIRAEWSPDGRWIAYLRQDAGRVQVWRSRVDRVVQQQVTHNADDVTNLRWKPDGSGLYFQVGRNRASKQRKEQEEADRGFLVDDRFMLNSLQPLWIECGGIPGIPEPDSQKCMPTTWVVDFANRRERKATPEDEQAYKRLNEPQRPETLAAERVVQGISWNRDKSHAAWFENEDPDTNAGYAVPLTLYAAGRRCAAAECHGQLKGLWWNDDEITFARREGHAYSVHALYAWRPGSDEVRLISRFDGVLESCEISKGAAICLHETPTSPRKIVALDLADGALRTVFDPNPEFKRFKLGAVEKLEWKDGYGNETFGHLVYPVGHQRGQRYPLVIVQYRSKGFLKGGVGEEYPIHPLSAEGFAVLSFDAPNDWEIEARRKPGDTSDAREWKDVYMYRRGLTALETIIDQLDRRGIVDPAKVGITGLSLGAGIVDFALFSSKRFAAAAHSGDGTPQMYWTSAGEWVRTALRNTWGVGAKTREKALKTWGSNSVIEHVDKVHTPLLVQVSDSEFIVASPILVAFEDAGKPVEFYTFPDEYHFKWQPQHKLAVYRRSIQWFRFWLMGVEDSDPVDPEQYSRWRKLRELQCKNRRSSRIYCEP